MALSSYGKNTILIYTETQQEYITMQMFFELLIKRIIEHFTHPSRIIKFLWFNNSILKSVILNHENETLNDTIIDN
jgi:hypothetical protein